jgi:hypothetical protein
MVPRGRLQDWGVTPAAAGMALSLAACAGRIWRDEAAEQGVRLHWYNDEGSIDGARAEAARYCKARNKRAELLEGFVDHDVTWARFAWR